MFLRKLPPRSAQHKFLFFLSDRKWREVVVQEIKNKNNSDTDYSTFTVNELKEILRDRDLPVSGIKQQLIERLCEDDMNNNTIVNKRGPSKQNKEENENSSRSNKDEEEDSSEEEEEEEEEADVE